MKYVVFGLVLLACSIVWAASKTTVDRLSRDVWSIASRNTTSGNTVDDVNVVRMIDDEQGVVCYLTITIAYQPAIYCLRVSK